MIFTFCAPAHVDARLFLVGQTLPEEVAAAVFLEGVIGFNGEEFTDPPADEVSTWNGIQVTARVTRLFCNPSAGAGRILVLKPTIRVGHGNAVQDFGHGLDR